MDTSSIILPCIATEYSMSAFTCQLPNGHVY